MTEPRVDYDTLKQRIINTNARLIDGTFEAYTCGQGSRKQEFVDQWKAAFAHVSDAEALEDGSDGMLLNGIFMEAIMKGEVRSDFADWVFPGERARRLARALEELVRVSGIVPRYNRRTDNMPPVIAAYRSKRPKMEGSFSSRLSASLSNDAADTVEDWMLHRGDWAPYVSRGDRTTSVFSDIKKEKTQQPSIADLQREQEEAVARKDYALAAELQTQIEARMAAEAADAAHAHPTLEQQTADLEREQNEAVVSKNYARAAELETQIEALKAQAVQQQVPDVASQIADLERQQDEAAAARNTARAAEFQRQIEELRAQQGPTLDQQVIALEQELADAASRKDYARAAELQVDLHLLSMPFVAELRRQPAPTPTPAAAVTPTATIVNGPLATDAAALETRRQEVLDIVSSKKFRLEGTRTSFLQQIYAAADATAVENLRQRVVAMP